MGEHTVASFDEDLGQIDQLIRDMGDLAGSMVGSWRPSRCCRRTMRWRSG